MITAHGDFIPEHKIGDEVTIKSREWYNAHKERDGYIRHPSWCVCFNPKMSAHCGEKTRIVDMNDYCYRLDGINQGFIDEFFEKE
jgi:hypothetical protein